MTIEVLKPGVLSTLQDLGRAGFQRFGVPVSGAMDEWSHRVANLLVGNPAGEATLEITLMGPSLRFTEPALIAIAGADLSPRIGGHAVPHGTPVLVRAGSQLDFGRRIAGLRSYFAVHAGFAVAPVMDSKSTYVRGGFGGFEGRALRKGDVLSIASASVDPVYPSLVAKLAGSAQPFVALDDPQKVCTAPAAGSPKTLRVTIGQQWDAFTAEAQQALREAEFRLSPQSDRMGLRLEGPKLALREPVEMISEAVAFGTIQVPPDGNPIILMADRQTTGGYPKIASVASVDLPLLAQMLPQQSLRFASIPLEDAQQLYLAREQALADIAARVNELRRR
jgi:antagonist of KipI